MAAIRGAIIAYAGKRRHPSSHGLLAPPGRSVLPGDAAAPSAIASALRPLERLLASTKGTAAKAPLQARCPNPIAPSPSLRDGGNGRRPREATRVEMPEDQAGVQPPAPTSSDAPRTDDVPAGMGEVVLIYDGGCPVCSAYARCVHPTDGGRGRLRRVDARAQPGVVHALRNAGMDLDAGMVVELDGRRHHGADALHMMALHGRRKGAFGRVNHLLFRSRRRSRALYPFLRAGRAVLLRALRRSALAPGDR